MATIKELAQKAGITSRTIRYYDEIGLLKPSKVHANGYRIYDEPALLRLQQILFYKELNVPLVEIKKILDDPGFDIIAALEQHKKRFSLKILQYTTLIDTIDRSIIMIKGNQTMSEKNIFKGFTPEQEEKYAKEAEKLYDPATVRESNRKWKEYGNEKQQLILAEGEQIYAELAKLVELKPTAAPVQALVQKWRDHMSYFWTPNLEQLIGLGQLYVSDERFRKNFEKYHPNLAEFFLQAIQTYVSERS